MRGAAAFEYLILVAAIAIALCTVSKLATPNGMLLSFSTLAIHADDDDQQNDQNGLHSGLGGGTNEGVHGRENRGHDNGLENN